jgi:hypothetical protein
MCHAIRIAKKGNNKVKRSILESSNRNERNTRVRTFTIAEHSTADTNSMTITRTGGTSIDELILRLCLLAMTLICQVQTNRPSFVRVPYFVLFITSMTTKSHQNHLEQRNN